MGKLKELIDLLKAQRRLPMKCKDHALGGTWKDYREARMEGDWLLIYRVENGTLRLMRTGTHADLFKM